MTPTQRYAMQTGKANKYTFITNTDDIIDRYILAHRDLHKKVKRDRYIMNSQGLQKDIEKVVNECLNKSATPLIDLVSTEIATEAYEKLNGTNITTIKNHSKINSLGSNLGKILGKSLVDGITNILEDK